MTDHFELCLIMYDPDEMQSLTQWYLLCMQFLMSDSVVVLWVDGKINIFNLVKLILPVTHVCTY